MFLLVLLSRKLCKGRSSLVPGSSQCPVNWKHVCMSARLLEVLGIRYFIWCSQHPDKFVNISNLEMRKKIWDLAWLNNLAKATQLLSNKCGIWAHICLTAKPGSPTTRSSGSSVICMCKLGKKLSICLLHFSLWKDLPTKQVGKKMKEFSFPQGIF